MGVTPFEQAARDLMTRIAGRRVPEVEDAVEDAEQRVCGVMVIMGQRDVDAFATDLVPYDVVHLVEMPPDPEKG